MKNTFQPQSPSAFNPSLIFDIMVIWELFHQVMSIKTVDGKSLMCAMNFVNVDEECEMNDKVRMSAVTQKR